MKDEKKMQCALHKCLLLTTKKAHAFMTERHGVISASGCRAARGRGFKECSGHEEKERPIIFSGEMARAILDDRKTQTRRAIKPQPEPEPARFSAYKLDEEIIKWAPQSNSGKIGIFQQNFYKCPYGIIGDRLWVRETFQSYVIADGKIYYHHKPDKLSSSGIFYKADNPVSIGVWIPSIHMPRWAARITLEITNVRVERVHEITPADVIAEGIIEEDGDGLELRNKFQSLWDSINEKRGFGWDINPWVWVIEFKREK